MSDNNKDSTNTEGAGPSAGLEAVGDRLNFHYQKTPQYRTIHCDGAFGGPTPNNLLSFTMYNERDTIPRRVSREIVEHAGGISYRLGPPINEEDLGGIMRQMEVTVMMDLSTAQDFYKWLHKQLEVMEDTLDVPSERRVVTSCPDKDGDT